MTKILVLAGSTSSKSYNRKLAQFAASCIPEAEHIELSDFEMPLYNADLEADKGLPESAVRLKKLFIECDGFCLACPEYNSCITPLFKNTLDWISRKESEDEPNLVAYKGKIAALISASPGALGGMRSLVTTRLMLSNIGTLVLPTQVCIPKAYEAFDDAGQLVDESKTNAIKNLMRELKDTCLALK